MTTTAASAWAGVGVAAGVVDAAASVAGAAAMVWTAPTCATKPASPVVLFDVKSCIPIWHASVSQSVSDLTGPNAVEKINIATSAIFTKFPGAGMPAPAGGRTTT